MWVQRGARQAVQDRQGLCAGTLPLFLLLPFFLFPLIHHGLVLHPLRSLPSPSQDVSVVPSILHEVGTGSGHSPVLYIMATGGGGSGETQMPPASWTLPLQSRREGRTQV